MPDAQVDPVRVQRVEGAELFGDDERLVVGQHDAARPDPDGVGDGGDLSDHHCGCGAGDAWHRVVFGEPEAVVAEPFA
ncbi:hypothetical protein M2284_000622 [Rhodococcus sp. LBL1]|nr:hypothetical protein [Rhodococcus sp. LBL1]MDH6681720.1 hypothetical protein [Rhodococcus sp. LBL2]